MSKNERTIPVATLSEWQGLIGAVLLGEHSLKIPLPAQSKLEAALGGISDAINQGE